MPGAGGEAAPVTASRPAAPEEEEEVQLVATIIISVLLSSQHARLLQVAAVTASRSPAAAAGGLLFVFKVPRDRLCRVWMHMTSVTRWTSCQNSAPSMTRWPTPPSGQCAGTS